MIAASLCSGSMFGAGPADSDGHRNSGPISSIGKRKHRCAVPDRHAVVLPTVA